MKNYKPFRQKFYPKYGSLAPQFLNWPGTYQHRTVPHEATSERASKRTFRAIKRSKLLLKCFSHAIWIYPGVRLVRSDQRKQSFALVFSFNWLLSDLGGDLQFRSVCSSRKRRIVTVADINWSERDLFLPVAVIDRKINTTDRLVGLMGSYSALKEKCPTFHAIKKLESKADVKWWLNEFWMCPGRLFQLNLYLQKIISSSFCAYSWYF